MNYKDTSNKLFGELVSNEEAVFNSLNNIIETRVGTVPGHPEFGSNLGKYLFEIINPLTAQLIKTELKMALKRWEPRITIIDITVQEDSDYNRLMIRVKYFIKAEVDNPEKEFIYKLQR